MERDLEKMLNKTLRETLEDIQNYKKELTDKIEREIEHKIKQDTPEIYLGVIPKHSIPQYLFPSVDLKTCKKEDLITENLYDESIFTKGIDDLSILRKYPEDSEDIILSFYVNEPYENIVKIIEENKNYLGYFQDQNNNRYEFEFKVQFNESFRKKETIIQRMFFENNLKYTGIFNPYSRKVFDIVITSFLTDVYDPQDIVSINLGDFEKNYNVDKEKIPCWNINFEMDSIMSLSGEVSSVNSKFSVRITPDREYFALFSSSESEISDIVRNDDFTKIIFNKEIKVWDICKIYNISHPKNLLSGIIKDWGITTISPFMPITKREISKRFQQLEKCLGLRIRPFRPDEFCSSPKLGYLNNFKYSFTNNFNEFFLATSEIFCKPHTCVFHVQKTYDEDSVIEYDKVMFALFHLNIIYPILKWVGVYDE